MSHAGYTKIFQWQKAKKVRIHRPKVLISMRYTPQNININTARLPKAEQWQIQHAKQSTESREKTASFAKTTKRGIKLYIMLEKHKLDQIAVTNIRTSLAQRIAFMK